MVYCVVSIPIADTSWHADPSSVPVLEIFAWVHTFLRTNTESKWKSPAKYIYAKCDKEQPEARRLRLPLEKERKQPKEKKKKERKEAKKNWQVLNGWIVSLWCET